MIIKYGPHKGDTYAGMLQNHPEYLEIVMRRFEGKTTPKYAQHFCNWINNEVPDIANSHIKGVRTRKGMLKRQPTPCPDGCTEFTSKGTNHKVNMRTCVVCGHGTKEDRVETPVYS